MAPRLPSNQHELPRPGTLTAYDVTAAMILDLADPEVRDAAGLDERFLRQPWKYFRDVERRRPPCRDFSAAASAGGWHGVRVPSVEAPGRNLVLRRWNAGGAPAVRHLDPLADLPRNEASWRD